MSKITDVASVAIEKSRVLFDTNVWIMINGFGADALKHKASLYSAGYKRLIERENSIVLNNYVLGEFFNRCSKIEYEIAMAEHESDSSRFPSFKVYRKSAEFRPVLESIQDTCLNMLDDCEFRSVDGEHYDIRSIVTD